ncbi:hypothetical protein NKH77_43750 [Streptomyces sp. M19]
MDDGVTPLPGLLHIVGGGGEFAEFQARLRRPTGHMAVDSRRMAWRGRADRGDPNALGGDDDAVVA